MEQYITVQKVAMLMAWGRKQLNNIIEVTFISTYLFLRQIYQLTSIPKPFKGKCYNYFYVSVFKEQIKRKQA